MKTIDAIRAAMNYTVILLCVSWITMPALAAETTLQGTYLNTVTDCFRDGDCYHEIKSGDRKVKVLFNYGDTPRTQTCLQVSAPDLHSGDRVEIFGIQDPDGSLSLCGSEKYYIRLLGTHETE